MTLAELSVAVANSRSLGHDWIILAVKPRRYGRRGPPQRIRLLPGLYGRPVSETETAMVVDCRIDDVERWLKRAALAAGEGT